MQFPPDHALAESLSAESVLLATNNTKDFSNSDGWIFDRRIGKHPFWNR